MTSQEILTVASRTFLQEANAIKELLLHLNNDFYTAVKTIDACLQPAQTNYLYFVASAARPGFHDFSETYEEHIKLAKKYQEKLDSLNIH